MNIGLSNLNLLFGMNGMGKSTTIQSLLLCRQSFWKNEKSNMSKLFPNGELVRLGTAKDIYCVSAEPKETLDIKLYYSEEQNYQFSYLYDDKMPHNNYMIAQNTNNGTNVNYDCSLFNDNFVYLSAEHLGPRNKYDYSEWNNSGINRFGINGEFIVPYLAMNSNYKVPEKLCCTESKSDQTLINQASAWMSRISPGVRFETELLLADQEAKLKIAYNEQWSVSDSYSPVNVGFGIPYVLPVITTLLTCNKDSLIIVENPESHLHPKGQAAIAELMAAAADYGAQIICESHSDHIINGVRVAVKEGKIDNSKVTVNYFQKDKNLNTEHEKIKIDKNGNLSNYPSGLLDEWGELMSKLI